MKRYVLLIAAMVGLTAGCQAASPSFSSFYTNHFLTNGLVIKANLNPTQFDTNASSITITITNVSGISGGSHWTNPVGVLKPRSGQTTNVLTFVSGSADNATNTALVVGTVNAWTDANAKLLTLRDVGTDVFYVTPHGSVEIGRSIAPWWLPDEGDILAGVHDVSQGDSDRSTLHIAAVDDAVSTVNFASHTVTLQSGANAQVASTTKAEVGGVESRITVALVPDQGTADFEVINTGETTFKVNSDVGVYARDTFYAGPNTLSLYGPFSNGEVLVAIDDMAEGDSGVKQIRVGIENGASTNAYATVYVDPDNSGVNYQTTTASGLTAIAINAMPVSHADAHENFVFQSTALSEDMWNFRPLLTDASTPTGAYQFSTYNTLTSKNLVEFANNGTNRISIGHTGQIIFGPGTTNVLFRNENNLVYTNGGNSVNFEVRKGDGASAKLGLSTGSHALLLGGAGSDVYVGVNNNGSGDFVFTSAAFTPTSHGTDGLGSPVNSWGNFYLTNSIFWSETNVLYRNARFLDYTNSSTGSNPTGIRVIDGDGYIGAFQTAGNVIQARAYSPAIAVGLVDSSDRELRWWSNLLDPLSTGTDIGNASAERYFRDIHYNRSLYAYGVSSAVNYSRGSITHTGNAGSVVYNSEALGTGSFRPHLFQIGGTNIARFDSTSSAGQTRFWLYDEDNGTMERVTVGAADSGGVGFKVLRIPN